MSIELRKNLEPNSANFDDDVGAAVEALERLGFVDRERLTEEITGDYRVLDNAGVPGERFVQIPHDLASLSEVVTVLDGGNFKRDYPQTYVYDRLWTPDYVGGEESDARQGQGRLAVSNPDNPNEPLLHFLDQPFDEMYANPDEQTQLTAIANAKKEYEANHPTFNMLALSAENIAFIALLRRIKGEKMPLEWGFMRDATRPRRQAGGRSWVGYVDSFGGPLKLRGSYGYASPEVGVGLSVGPEPEASA